MDAFVSYRPKRTAPVSFLLAFSLPLTCLLAYPSTASSAMPTDPLHIFLNISESAMSSIIPLKIQEFITRGSSHQVRIYPKGTRIRSNNYNPAPYWRGGAQICAQNWQRFDKGMQVTRAMFEGTDGWLLKPKALLGEHAREKEIEEEREEDESANRIMIGPQRFSCEVLGVSAGAFVCSCHSGLVRECTSSNIAIMANPLYAPND